MRGEPLYRGVTTVDFTPSWARPWARRPKKRSAPPTEYGAKKSLKNTTFGFRSDAEASVFLLRLFMCITPLSLIRFPCDACSIRSASHSPHTCLRHHHNLTVTRPVPDRASPSRPPLRTTPTMHHVAMLTIQVSALPLNCIIERSPYSQGSPADRLRGAAMLQAAPSNKGKDAPTEPGAQFATKDLDLRAVSLLI